MALSRDCVERKELWDETLTAARREGKVVLSGPPVPEPRQALPAAFKDRYGIAVEFVPARGGTDAAARMRAERQAGIHHFDIIFAAFRATTSTKVICLRTFFRMTVGVFRHL